MSLNKVKNYVAQIECFNSPSAEPFNKTEFGNICENNNSVKKFLDIDENSVSSIRNNFLKIENSVLSPLSSFSHSRILLIQTNNYRSMESLSFTDLPLDNNSNSEYDQLGTSKEKKFKKTPIPLPRKKGISYSVISKSSNNINDLCLHYDQSPSTFSSKINDFQFTSMDAISDIIIPVSRQTEQTALLSNNDKEYHNIFQSTEDNNSNLRESNSEFENIWQYNNIQYKNLSKIDNISLIFSVYRLVNWTSLLMTSFEHKYFQKDEFAMCLILPLYSVNIDQIFIQNNLINLNDSSEQSLENLFKLQNHIKEKLETVKINQDKILNILQEKYPVEKFLFKYRRINCDCTQVLHLLIVVASQIKRAKLLKQKHDSVDKLLLKFEEASKLKKDIEDRQIKLLNIFSEILSDSDYDILIKSSIEPIVIMIIEGLIEEHIENKKYG